MTGLFVDTLKRRGCEQLVMGIDRRYAGPKKAASGQWLNERRCPPDTMIHPARGGSEVRLYIVVTIFNWKFFRDRVFLIDYRKIVT